MTAISSTMGGRFRRLSRAVAASILITPVLVGVATVAVSSPAHAVDDGQAITPPMGFNDWNAFGCDVSAKLIKETADEFASTGLKDAGYKYVNIDDCWMTHERDPQTGRLVPDPVKFPDGIKAVADYVHSKGLKIGIYEDAGSQTCARYPGSLGHETVDAQTFADWKIDYLKYDNCNNEGSTTTGQYIDRYKAMGDALKATGRDIIYSICEWGVNDPWKWAGTYGHLWRTTGDINDSWGSMLSILKANAGLDAYAKPGAWNDPDMLEVGNGGMTDTEYRTHFSMWAEMAAPLLIGTDLRTASDATMDIYLNKDVIAVDQDSLGKQGKEIESANGLHVFAKPLANGDVSVALFNETDSAATIDTSADAVGIADHQVYNLKDLWSKQVKQTTGQIAASVPSHGTVMYRVSASRKDTSLQPQTALTISAPQAYEGGPSVVEPGQAVKVTATFENDGVTPVKNANTVISAPDGWTVRADGKTKVAKLAAGASQKTRWTVTAPSGLRAGTYKIAASTSYLWGSRYQTSVSASTNLLQATPVSDGQLGDASWVSSTNGWGPVERNTSNGEKAAGDGKPITVQGQVFDHGLGVNSPSEIVYYLGKKCSTVSAQVGVDDEVGERGNTVGFEIWVDGAKAASTTAASDEAPKPLSTSVDGASFVTLKATDGGDGMNYDHADWADAKVVCG